MNKCVCVCAFVCFKSSCCKQTIQQGTKKKLKVILIFSAPAQLCCPLLRGPHGLSCIFLEFLYFTNLEWNHKVFIIPLQMSDFKMKITVSYVKKYLVRAWEEFMQWCFKN